MSTSLWLSEHRNRTLYALLSDPSSRILTRADVHLRLGRFWTHDTIEARLCDLAESGVIAEGPMGELIVGPDAWSEAA